MSDAKYWFAEARRRADANRGTVVVTIDEWREIVDLFTPTYEPMPQFLVEECARLGIPLPEWPESPPKPTEPQEGDRLMGYPLIVQ